MHLVYYLQFILIMLMTATTNIINGIILPTITLLAVGKTSTAKTIARMMKVTPETIAATSNIMQHTSTTNEINEENYATHI